MTPDAIDRLCERIEHVARRSLCADVDPVIADVRAALEGERERFNRLRAVHLKEGYRSPDSPALSDLATAQSALVEYAEWAPVWKRERDAARARVGELERSANTLIVEADFMLSGGDDPSDVCQECGLAGVGMFRDALAKLREIVRAGTGETEKAPDHKAEG